MSKAAGVLALVAAERTVATKEIGALLDAAARGDPPKPGTARRARALRSRLAAIDRDLTRLKSRYDDRERADADHGEAASASAAPAASSGALAPAGPPVAVTGIEPGGPDDDALAAVRSELERALDREASLRAQNDMLELRRQRTNRELRAARESIESLTRDRDGAAERTRQLVEQERRQAATDAAIREAALRQRSEEQQAALVRFAGLLSRTARYLVGRVKQAELLVQYELADELQRYKDEVPYLNPRLLASRAAATEAATPPQGAASIRRQMRLIAESQLFHADYYRRQWEGGLPSGADPLRHYVTTGWLAGKDPNPLFSVPFYLMRNPDILAAGTEPLGHYIESGSTAKRDPHPLFVTSYYAARCGDLPAPGTTWLRHFLRLGAPAASPHPMFDPVAYAKRAGLSETHAAVALLHYLLLGWRRGIDFSPLFNARHYRSQLSEGVVETEPYCHYVLYGTPHQLSPHPLFHPRHYLRERPHANPLEMDPLVDYLLAGEAAGAAPCPFFDPAFYRKAHMAAGSTSSALAHYLADGVAAEHDPHPDFDARLYKRLPQPGAPPPGVGALEHFLAAGLFQIEWDEVPGVVAGAASPQFARRPSPALREDAPPAPTPNAAALQIRHYPGKVAVQEGRPNVLLVAHVAAEHLFGGERSFLDMIDGLAHLPVNIVVALPRNVPAYTNRIRAQCLSVYVFDYKWWRKGEASSPAARAAFKQIIAEGNIDAVHVNTMMLREPLEAARECGLPGTVHVRELIGQDVALQELIGHPPDEIIAATRQRADWIIGNSNTTASTFLKPDRTFVIANTIDLEAMDMANEISDGELRLGLISSNIPKKGLADVVELARLAATAAPKARFVIIGPETDLVRNLKQEQQAGAVPGNVVFAGYAAGPREAISQVNVVLSFSHFAESFGRTVLEAMAARRPVIAYEWGAVPELLRHGENGYLVPFRRPELALPHVEELCRRPQLVHTLGEKGRAAAVAGFGLGNYRAAFARAYAEILPKSRPGGAPAPDGPIVKAARRPGLKTPETALRVAYFCWHFPVPSETFVLAELEVLVRDGADVIVFCRQSPHKTFVPPFPIAYERVDSPQRLAQRLRETSRTIVHAHFTYPTVTDMVWPACEMAEIPFTFVAHAQDIFRYENDAKNRLAEIGASRWCRKLFTLSRFHLDYVLARGFPRDKVVINPNAVDVARFAAAAVAGREARTTRRIIAVHRFVEKKGIDRLIRASALVQDLGVAIDIYGYGEREEEYRRLIADLGLRNVALRGALTRDQVVEVMRDADLFACPSVRTENGDMDGIPTSLVESMAAGLPVLTTSVAGIPDLVVDGITGIVTDSDPASIAAAIRRFYALPDLKLRAIIATARERATRRHDAVRTTRVLTRVWQNRTIDVVVVAWNNLAELRTVLRRVIENTALPYHLIVCDNRSTREPVADYLDSLWRDHDQLTVIHNHRNAMVGPGTNLALAQGISDYAIYLCGKECISFANGWEIPFVHALDEQPDAGLVGSIGYSPSYLTGSQYATGIKLFPKFRNRDFAARHPNRTFGHVQGGLFALRRAMCDEIGGFSEEVPHDYTDVEYSYYAESRGWKLAEVPGVLAFFNKSRPTLSQRFDETTIVAHPVLMDEIPRFEAVARGTARHCNICDWFGDDFPSADMRCPRCGCGPEDRTLYRWLGEGILMYRRLPALAVGLSGRMDEVWSQQYQGHRGPLPRLLDELKAEGRLANRPNSFEISAARFASIERDDLTLLAGELRRLLRSGAPAVFQLDGRVIEPWQRQKDQLCAIMHEHGFRARPDVVFASHAVEFSYVPMQVFERE